MLRWLHNICTLCLCYKTLGLLVNLSKAFNFPKSELSVLSFLDFDIFFSAKHNRFYKILYIVEIYFLSYQKRAKKLFLSFLEKLVALKAKLRISFI